MQQGAAKRPTIGIVGGGQLGRMLTEAAKPLGYDVVVVDPSANCPAAQVGAAEITANLYDEAALKELTSRSDVITVEIEHLDTHVLEALENDGAVIHPAPATVRLIQDKYLQKVFLREHSVPVADFTEVASTADAEAALKNFGGKMLLKTRHGAYDGRGNMVVSSPADIKKAFELFDGKALYAEAFVPFERELAVMVGRSTSGDVQAYPVVQTIHQRNICVEVLSPAPVSKTVTQKAHTLAVTVANLLKGAGMYGIEMFLTENGEVLVNEIAPRVHNSGHHTTEGNRTSQFEQHIRAITGLPLGDVSLTAPATVMVNILGERNGETRMKGLGDALTIPDVHIHLYGKSPTKVDRKMGHITATADTLETARKRARDARKALNV
jgi:phosphoribosylaminoimidazole carboxylase PurK protein